VTNIGDVVRQVETALNDPWCPPTPEEKEVLTTILSKAYTGTLSKVYAGTLSRVYTGPLSRDYTGTVESGEGR
jgi:hypothetical protein